MILLADDVDAVGVGVGAAADVEIDVVGVAAAAADDIVVDDVVAVVAAADIVKQPTPALRSSVSAPSYFHSTPYRYPILSQNRVTLVKKMTRTQRTARVTACGFVRVGVAAEKLGLHPDQDQDRDQGRACGRARGLAPERESESCRDRDSGPSRDRVQYQVGRAHQNEDCQCRLDRRLDSPENEDERRCRRWWSSSLAWFTGGPRWTSALST